MSRPPSSFKHAFIAFALVGGILLVFSSTPLPAAAETGQPDWIVDSLTTLENTVRVLGSNIVIENGGELRLNNSTLIMNGSKEGELQILVKQGGRLQADGANITWGQGRWHYWFQVNGTLDIRDCAISGLRGQFDTGGIYLAPTSTATISRCHFAQNQWYAAIANGSSPVISDCDIDAVKAGIRVENGGAPTISGNTIRGAERQAIIVLNSAPMIRNNRILDGHQGMDLQRSKAQISGNEISGCQAWGIQCYDFSDADITGNAISGCAEEGISVVASAPTLVGNVIYGNGIGVNATTSSTTLTKNSIYGNRGWGVFCRSGAPVLSGNNFTDGRGTDNPMGDVAVVWSLTVVVEEQGHGPVAGANISITDSSGKTVFRGSTGDDGTVPGIELYQYRIDSGSRQSGTPHRLSVKKGDLSASSEIRMDKDQTITAKLVKTSTGFIPGPSLAMAALACILAAVMLRRKNA
jgi:parallel beta-helix repeat protein